MVKDSFRLYDEDTGGTGPTLLFLHGAGGNHLSWWQQVPVFAEEYRCVSADQRGFGQSPDVPGGPGPTALAGDALALLMACWRPTRSCAVKSFPLRQSVPPSPRPITPKVREKRRA
jgi:pimeloyl-ACP methyl ester carboxylesterase